LGTDWELAKLLRLSAATAAKLASASRRDNRYRDPLDIRTTQVRKTDRWGIYHLKTTADRFIGGGSLGSDSIPRPPSVRQLVYPFDAPFGRITAIAPIGAVAF